MTNVTSALVAELGLSRKFPALVELHWMNKRGIKESPVATAIAQSAAREKADHQIQLSWRFFAVGVLSMSAVALVASVHNEFVVSNLVSLGIGIAIMTIAHALALILAVQARVKSVDTIKNAQLEQFSRDMDQMYRWLRFPEAFSPRDFFSRSDEKLVADADGAIATSLHELKKAENELKELGRAINDNPQRVNEAVGRPWHRARALLLQKTANLEVELHAKYDALKELGLAPHEEPYYEQLESDMFPPPAPASADESLRAA